MKLTNEQGNEFDTLLFNVLNEGIIVYNEHGIIVAVNNAVCNLFHCNSDDLIGLHIFDIIPNSDQDVFSEFSEQISKGITAYKKISFIKSDESIFQSEVKGLFRVIENNKKNVLILSGTKQQINQKDLAENHDETKRIIHHIPDIIWTRDDNGNTIFISDNVKDIFGYDTHQFFQDQTLWNKLIHPDDISNVKNAYEKLFLENKPYDIDYRLQNKNGNWVWVNDRSSTPYQFDDIYITDGILSIIEKRKKNELESKEAKKLFETLFNSMADPVMILDKKGKFLALTDRVKEYTGFEKQEILGQNFLKTKLLTPKSKAICIKNLLKRMAGIHVDPYEVEALTKDGELIPFEVNAKRITYMGEPADLVIFRDISSRVEAEKKLRQSEKTYRNLFQNAQVGLFRTNLDDGRIIECNNQLAKMFGFKNRINFIKQYTIEKFYVHPEDREDLINNLKKNGYVDHFEAAFYRKDKSIFWARYSATLDTEHNWLEGVFEDITELKKAEDKLKMKHDQLKSEQQQLLSIFDSINHAIYVSDPETYEILYTNSKLRQSLKKDVTGRKCYEAIQNKTQPCEFCTNHIILNNKGKPYKWEYRNPSTKRFYELIDRIITWPDGRDVRMELALDITDRKRAMDEIKRAHQTVSAFNKELEKKVREKTERIEKLLKQKDEFINQLGHDLKNPLGPLINLLPLVENHITEEKYKEMIRVSRRNVGYMKNLVVKTIELAKLNSPRTHFIFEPIPLFSIVENIIESNKYLTSQKNIQIKNKIQKDLIVPADKLRMEELITNLLNNAIKYSIQNGLIEIAAIENTNDILLSITDDGIGMNKDQIVHLFDEFYKADESRHDFESSGLGLPICKRIVERHRGQIWAESPGINQGSTIFVRLPKKETTINEKDLSNTSLEETVDQKIDDLVKNRQILDE